jgi:hypothetical protein
MSGFLMIKVVLDTNVLVSALIRNGKPRALLFEMVRGNAQLILSRGILEELAEVAADDKIRKYVEEEDVTRFLRIIGSTAKIVTIKSRFKEVKRDPSDDLFLRTAYDGGADYIISGDRHLLSLKEFRGIKILTVNEVLDLI